MGEEEANDDQGRRRGNREGGIIMKRGERERYIRGEKMKWKKKEYINKTKTKTDLRQYRLQEGINKVDY